MLGILLVLGLAPMELGGSVALQGTRDRLSDLALTNLTSRSTATAAAIDSYIQTRRRDIVAVSQVPDIIAYAQNIGDAGQRNLARAALAAAAGIGPEYESIAVLDLNGTVMAASIQTDEGTNLRFRDYFQNARTGQAYISDPSYSVITNKPALFFSAPVKTTDGVLVGVVRSRINLGVIWDLVENDLGSIGAGARSFLVDDFGIRLAVAETKGNRDKAESLIYKVIAPIERDVAVKLAADRRFGQKSAEQLVVDPLPELRSVIDGMTRPGAVPFSFTASGVDTRAVATKMESKPWVYVVTMPPASYTVVLAGANTGQTAGVVFAVALAALIAAWFARSLIREDAATRDGRE
jgi:C4-dicarboxylate-specific signal transduction histidine kinase